jgi:hypothetical protein
LVEVVQRIVVIRRDLAIGLPRELAEDIEPLAVDGVQQMCVVAVSLWGATRRPRPLRSEWRTEIRVVGGIS